MGGNSLPWITGNGFVSREGSGEFFIAEVDGVLGAGFCVGDGEDAGFIRAGLAVVTDEDISAEAVLPDVLGVLGRSEEGFTAVIFDGPGDKGIRENFCSRFRGVSVDEVEVHFVFFFGVFIGDFEDSGIIAVRVMFAEVFVPDDAGVSHGGGWLAVFVDEPGDNGAAEGVRLFFRGHG